MSLEHRRPAANFLPQRITLLRPEPSPGAGRSWIASHGTSMAAMRSALARQGISSRFIRKVLMKLYRCDDAQSVTPRSFVGAKPLTGCGGGLDYVSFSKPKSVPGSREFMLQLVVFAKVPRRDRIDIHVLTCVVFATKNQTISQET